MCGFNFFSGKKKKKSKREELRKEKNRLFLTEGEKFRNVKLGFSIWDQRERGIGMKGEVDDWGERKEGHRMRKLHATLD